METHRYPRPQLERKNWTNLNGDWDFFIDENAQLRRPGEVEWNSIIKVPFAPETIASGVNNTGFYKACWYKRSFDRPVLGETDRLMLHFGAVDWHASVWINGSLAATHEGGYTPFSVDVTDLLIEGYAQTIVVRAEDDPLDFSKPRGKQDWELHSHSIWYPRTTGIWQTVWLETVCENAIASIQWSCDTAKWEIGLKATAGGPVQEGLQLTVKLRLRDRILVNDAYSLINNAVEKQIRLPDPGIDAARKEFLWSPEHPALITAELVLRDAQDNVLDRVSSYTAMRSVEVDHQRFLLNGRPYPLRLVLDQGYWPESGMTAPDDAALRNDVELVKLMKFNGVRKHQKIEDPRFLYWADYLGLLVWEEMPSAYAFNPKAVQRLCATWLEVIERDRNHPCVIAWVPFNESWGLPDLTKSAAQRDYLRSIYFLTKSLDGSRPVIGNDGWEMVATDIVAIHDYGEPKEIARRFNHDFDKLGSALSMERPGGRVLLLEDLSHEGRAIMLTEFGGICLSNDERAWGYRIARTPEEFSQRYKELLETVQSLTLLSGYCYTQLTDTYQEANGLLFMDRTPKFPLEEIARATSSNIKESFFELSQPDRRSSQENRSRESSL